VTLTEKLMEGERLNGAERLYLKQLVELHLRRCPRCGFEYSHAAECPRCIVDGSTFSVIEERDAQFLRPVGVEQVQPDGTVIDHALYVGALKVICYTHGAGCLFTDLRLRGVGFAAEYGTGRR